VAVIVGEAAVRIRPDVDGGEFRSEVDGPVGDALEDAGGSGAARFTAAFGAALAIGGAFAASLESAALGDKLAAQLGATEGESERYGAVAGDLYANAYGDSLETVNGAIRGVVQNIGGMADASSADLQAVTGSVLDLSTAMDQDVGAVSQSVGRLIQTGLAANAEEALDILTRGFQEGADRGGDLLDVVGEYGTTFTELGLSGGQSIGLLNQALAAGIPNADFAADALREMGIIAREGGEEAAAALDDLGLSADDYFAGMQEGGPAASAALDTVLDALRSTEDPALRSAAATALVGTQYEDLGDAILALDPSAAVDGLGQIEGAAASMGGTLNDNASTNLTTFWRTAQTAFVDIVGGRVIPIVETVAAALATTLGPAIESAGSIISTVIIPAVQSLATWITNNQTPITVVAGLIAAVFLPHLIALGVQSTITGLKVVAGWVMTQASAIGAAIVHSAQIALMIGKFAALAASSAINVARIIGGWVLMGVQSMIQAGRMAAAWLIAMGPVGIIIGIVIGLVALVIANWEKVKAFTVGAFRAVVSAVSGAFRSVTSAVSSGIGTVIGFFSGLPGRILRAVGNLGSLLAGAGRGLIEGFVNGISSAASFVGDIAGSIWRSVRGFINSNVIDRLNGLLEFSIMGVTVNPPDIPRLHSGGVFSSGSSSGEGLALLRDDELVATPEQRGVADDLLRGLLSGNLPDAGGRNLSPVGGANVHIDVHPSPGMDERVLSAHVANDLGWQLASGATRPVALLGGTS
jgi:hypothetical protein